MKKKRSRKSAPRAQVMLLFRDSRPEAYRALSPEERQRLVQRWRDWYDGLAARGQVLHGQPLEPTGCVVSGATGEIVADGPFAETKEGVGGYFLLSVASFAAAVKIARRCPSLPLGISVEVRPVAAFSPNLTELCGQPPRARRAAKRRPR